MSHVDYIEMVLQLIFTLHVVQENGYTFKDTTLSKLFCLPS